MVVVQTKQTNCSTYIKNRTKPQHSKAELITQFCHTSYLAKKEAAAEVVVLGAVEAAAEV